MLTGGRDCTGLVPAAAPEDGPSVNWGIDIQSLAFCYTGIESPKQVLLMLPPMM